MAAFDTFESFNESLTASERSHIATLAKAYMQDLLAARSEDARKRIVEQYIKQVVDAPWKTG